MLRLPVLVLLTVTLTAGQELTPAERQSHLDSFEFVWKTVRDTYWDPKMGGLDWQAAHDELLPKVEAAKTTNQARLAMSELLERLKQTHFGVFPGDVYKELDTPGRGPRNANPGIGLRVLEGRAIVTSVEPGSPAASKGVKPGWEIVSVNGREMAPVLAGIQKLFASSTLLDLRLTRSVLSRLQGALGSTVKLELRDGRDQPVPLELERAQPRGKIASLGNFPGEYIWTEWRKEKPDVAYLGFNIFLDPEGVVQTVEQAVKGCRECAGFVIDLRGNPGGIGGLAMGVAGWFTDQSGLHLGTEYLRGTTLKFVIFPRPEPFRGPLAILVDGCSASTAEIFAGGLKDIGRARIFGSRTAGAALPSIITRLPNGDGFQYAIANYISQGGKALEGIGVIPDDPISPSRQQLLEGRDPVLEAAVAWIQKQKK